MEERKWHTQFHRPVKGELNFSVQVLIYSPALKLHSIGWFDFELDKWTHIADEEMADFVWTELESLVPKEIIVQSDRIRCPECDYLQYAEVTCRVGDPFATHIKHCEACDYTIMESEWNIN